MIQSTKAVMPGPVPGIHVFDRDVKKDVDGRHKAGHDEFKLHPDTRPQIALARAMVVSGLP